jgi:GNAT superfamily N-acetyltransferase
MALTGWEVVQQVDTQEVTQLGPADAAALEELYAASYPGNWFQPRMLETGCYYGIRQGERILSVAGVHVYSRRYRAAALGNITTHPEFRGRGFGRAVTAKVCQALRGTAEAIGLNVKVDNIPAVACYRRLGFELIASYEECTLQARQAAPERAPFERKQ